MYITIPLTRSQAEMLADLSSRFLFLVGGLGSSKTTALVLKALQLAEVNWPVPVMVIEKDYPLIKDVLLPTFRDTLARWHAPLRYNKQEHDLYTTINGKEICIWLRSSTRPEAIIGSNIAAVLVDEAAFIPEEIAQNASERVRHPLAKVRQFVGVGTPDMGKRGWFYDWAAGELSEKENRPTRLIRASTRDNYFLPEDYIETHLSHFEGDELRRYVDGEFLDFAGRVYSAFDSDFHIAKCDNPEIGDQWVTLDFGYYCAPWVFGRTLNGIDHVTGELVFEKLDTHEQGTKALEFIRQRNEDWFGEDVPGEVLAQRMELFCDPAGSPQYRPSSSDVRILERLGFHVRYKNRHDPVRNRINAVQQKLRAREFFIDADAAPYTAKCLAEQAYGIDGMPEKGRPRDGRKGLDHGADAIGYKIEITDPAAQVLRREYGMH